MHMVQALPTHTETLPPCSRGGQVGAREGAHGAHLPRHSPRCAPKPAQPRPLASALQGRLLQPPPAKRLVHAHASTPSQPVCSTSCSCSRRGAAVRPRCRMPTTPAEAEKTPPAARSHHQHAALRSTPAALAWPGEPLALAPLLSSHIPRHCPAHPRTRPRKAARRGRSCAARVQCALAGRLTASAPCWPAPAG